MLALKVGIFYSIAVIIRVKKNLKKNMSFFKNFKYGVKSKQIENHIKDIFPHMIQLLDFHIEHGSTKYPQNGPDFNAKLKKIHDIFEPMMDEAINISINVPYPPYKDSLASAVMQIIFLGGKLELCYNEQGIVDEGSQKVFTIMTMMVNPGFGSGLSFHESIKITEQMMNQ